MLIPETTFNLFESLMPLASVNAIISNEKNEVLIVKRNIKPAKNLYWFPGGIIKKGQTFQEALQDEIQEELGLKWSNLEIVKLLNVASCRFETRHTIEINFLLRIKQDTKIQLNKEHSEYQWIKPENLEKEGFHSYLKWVLEGNWGNFIFDF